MELCRSVCSFLKLPFLQVVSAAFLCGDLFVEYLVPAVELTDINWAQGKISSRVIRCVQLYGSQPEASTFLVFLKNSSATQLSSVFELQVNQLVLHKLDDPLRVKLRRCQGQTAIEFKHRLLYLVLFATLLLKVNLLTLLERLADILFSLLVNNHRLIVILCFRNLICVNFGLGVENLACHKICL